MQPVGRDIEQARGVARLHGPLGYELVREIEVEKIDAHLQPVQYDVMGDFSTRPATADDAAAIAGVFSPSFRLLSFLPALHTEEEDRWFIENVVLKECIVTVAEGDEGIVAFLALQGEEVRMLYAHPDVIGAGAGSLLIEGAKRSGEAALELWCFQANTLARRFYERHGFKAIRFTDGHDNEEKMPDVRYRWARDP
jgi:GNAT superfamily N-acetyltransferase